MWVICCITRIISLLLDAASAHSPGIARTDSSIDAVGMVEEGIEGARPIDIP